MAQSIIEEIGHILPPSRNLADTLARAADYATQQSHPEVTLEHLLLALTEDPDAAAVMSISRIEIDQLKGDISTHLGRLEDRSAAAGAVGISTNLRQILEASAAAARGRRNSIDGAIVLAAIVGDGRSTAAHLLRAHGLTFEEAIKALQQAAQLSDETEAEATAPAAPASAPDATPHGADHASVSPPPAEHESSHPRPAARATSDEILASARQRVHDRTAPDVSATATGSGEPTEQSVPAPSDDATDGGTGPELAPVKEESTDRSTAPASEHSMPDTVSAEAAPTISTVPIAQSQPTLDAEAAGPGPQPAPPSRRPLPPGALRPGDIEAGSQAPRPLEPAPPARDSRIEEHAIDEVLASIRKSGRAVSDQPPPSQPILPTVPSQSKTGYTAPPPSRPFAPPPAGSAGPSHTPPRSAHAQPGMVKPTDRDFFGPPMSAEANARANPPAHQMPLPPPPPGRQPGPPRAPLPGLPPIHDVVSGGAAPMPRPQQRAEAAPAGGMPSHRTSPMPSARRAGAPNAPQRSAPPSGPPGMAPTVTAEAPTRQRSAELSLGEMVENVPRVMRVGIPVLVEARIGRAEVKALAEGLQGGGAVWRHDLTVTKAMSVRLRAPDGGFYIETASPETQWIENSLGLITDDYASWRWTVTAKERGSKRLQLIISARTVGTDGLAAETALPDQVVTVKVRVNYARTAKMLGGWMLAAIAGGVLARFGEDLPGSLMSLMGSIFR